MIRPPHPPLRLFKGHTVHQRSERFESRFRYGLAMIEIDIDRLAAATRLSRLFSVGRPNLFSFKADDHGARDKGTTLRDWAETQFELAGIDLHGGPVRLLTFPRHLFYKFAPISVWLGYAPDGQIAGVIYEVNNTFGETHTYIAKTPETGRSQHATDKVFHVSPFFDVSGQYRFTLRVSEARLSLMVATFKGETQTHLATLQGRFMPATSVGFAGVAVSKPLSTLGVSLAIHWQALKLWIKGAAYHSKPKQIEPRISIASTQTAPQPMSQESPV